MDFASSILEEGPQAWRAMTAGRVASTANATTEGLVGGNTTRLLLDLEEASDAHVPRREQEPAGRMAHVKDKMRRLTMATVSPSDVESR